MEGKIRKIFPGANTANGSFNFFDNIIQGDINRIFCFKGHSKKQFKIDNN